MHAPGAGAADGDRYELLGELATGGMATVYLGRMRRPMGFSRLVAIKCMHPQYAKDPSFASMFVDEARLTARLRHPNIVPTLDIIADGGHLLIVMEYVEGESLAGLIRLVRDAGEKIPVAVACAIIHDVLLGIHEAHEARDDDGAALAIIHRDVSPQNVLVGLDGLARVLDFGVAKARSSAHHSCEGEIKGKIPYMPPEQLFGEAVDRRVDVYAAGVLLWEALCGARLFEGPNEEALVRRIDTATVAPPSSRVAGISPELDAVVLRALARKPEDRFSSALEMAEALSAIAAPLPRTEISAWMKRFTRPRAVPPVAIGSSRDLTPATVDADGRASVGRLSPDNAEAIVAALERATIASLVSRPSVPPVVTPVQPPRASSRVAMVLGIAAFAVAGVVAGRAMRAENAHAAAAHRSVATAERTIAPPAAATISENEASAIAVAPATVKAEAPVAAPRVVARAHAPSAPKVAPAIATTSETAPIPTTPDPKPTSCRLPYVVDAEGHRHYKAECL
ncbi:MAG: protein kinase [Labilithrix sp.]|nr:protein kinase [Labilithrix sp.]